ncbi:ribonuclease H-like domain-containing protein [Tanacetum coccineum]
MHDPRESHLAALKWVLHYVHGTLDHGLKLHVSSTSQLNAYTNADWAGWIRNLLRELHNPLFTATLVYCDNVRVLHVPSRYQYADIFTKGLPSALFEEFRTSLSVRSSLAQTAGEC